MYYDLKNDRYVKYKPSFFLSFIYKSVIGRIFLKVLTTKWVANMYMKFMNSPCSKYKIKHFIKKNNINMDDYKNEEYNSFNSFFIRDIKDGKRLIGEDLIAVCDSKLMIYKIEDNSFFKIKDSIYNIQELIQDDSKFKYALIFRLSVDDYHHYIFPDDGHVLKTKYINGILHTVQPIAHKKYKVFHENSREVTFLDCKNLGRVCYIEVGAMLVGKICNEIKTVFKKGEEKGHFEFGGSTIILLLEKEFEFDNKILENSNKGIETIVKMGDKIGV